MRVVRVNRRTLSLFGADDLPHLVANLDAIFRDEMLVNLVDELAQLWDGKGGFVGDGVNYSLAGRRIDIQVKGSLLPGYEASWERVLIAVEDVSEREGARRLLALSEDYSRGLFEHSPISLWVEDFSRVKLLLEELRDRGIEDFRVFTDVHPEFVTRCMSEIRVIDVNNHTLSLFGAHDKKTLLRRLHDVFRDAMAQPFREQLIDLWNGKLFQQREVVNYSLDGVPLHLHLQFSIFPGREKDWSLVQVALTDITARKKAEAYLEYLGKHDVLTKLFNRSFFEDELNRLERNGPAPVTVLVIDINGLKDANDRFGHAAGDKLLRRAGEVLSKLVEEPCRVGANRRRRIRGAHARARRARRRRDDRRHRQSGGAQQSVLFGRRAQLRHRGGDQSAGGAARSRRAQGRRRDVFAKARLLLGFAARPQGIAGPAPRRARFAMRASAARLRRRRRGGEACGRARPAA